MIDDDRPNPFEELEERRAHLARRRWVPERREGETDADYSRRYAEAEFRAHLDGYHGGRTTYIDGFGEQQWSDLAGGRWS